MRLAGRLQCAPGMRVPLLLCLAACAADLDVESRPEAVLSPCLVATTQTWRPAVTIGGVPAAPPTAAISENGSAVVAWIEEPSSGSWLVRASRFGGSPFPAW